MWLAVSPTASKKTFLRTCSHGESGVGIKLEGFHQNCAHLKWHQKRNDIHDNSQWIQKVVTSFQVQVCRFSYTVFFFFFFKGYEVI